MQVRMKLRRGRFSGAIRHYYHTLFRAGLTESKQRRGGDQECDRHLADRPDIVDYVGLSPADCAAEWLPGTPEVSYSTDGGWRTMKKMREGSAGVSLVAAFRIPRSSVAQDAKPAGCAPHRAVGCQQVPSAKQR
jgi:hypothetical protein